MNSNFSSSWPSINLLRRYRDLWVVLLLLVVPLVVYTAHRKPSRDHNGLDRAVVGLSAPLQWLMVASIDAVADVWHHYVALVHAQRHNDSLRADNAQLQAQLQGAVELQQENHRLRQLWGLAQRAPGLTMLPATVIATSPSPLFRALRIDRGSSHGLKVGDAVVTHAGVVGRIAAIAARFSDVMLLVDSNSSTDVLVQRTRVRGRVRGDGGDSQFSLELHYLPRTVEVQPGDMLITSGLGKTFPKGLPIGQVTRVQRRAFGLYQQARVEPTVDFRRLETVLVIPAGYPQDSSFEAGTALSAATPAPPTGAQGF